MNIMYEDDEIVVCVKPEGFLSQEGKGENMVTALKELLDSEIYPVHRLDKAVSGVMVFAKTAAGAASLSKQIAEHSFEKEYRATVWGELEEKEGVFEDLLFRDSSKNKSYIVGRMRKGVKLAKLSYTVIDTGELNGKKVSFVSVHLFTGRTHQIRVQFASRKHPLVGDRKYGSKDDAKRLELRSQKIGFFHPKTGERMVFEKD